MICASPDGENSFCARCWHLKSVIHLLTIAAGTVMIECWVHLDNSIDGIPPPPGVVWDEEEPTGDNSTKLADEAAAQEAAAAENGRFLPTMCKTASGRLSMSNRFANRWLAERFKEEMQCSRTGNCRQVSNIMASAPPKWHTHFQNHWWLSQNHD